MGLTAIDLEPIVLDGVGTRAVDLLMDLGAEIIATKGRARARDVRMLAAHRAGKDGCEVCGRALVRSVPVHDERGERVSQVGPECAKRIRKLLADAG